jgi:6-phosphogluconolactonase
MKTTRRTFLTAAACAPVVMKAMRAAAQGGGERLLYVGTYTNNASSPSKGIYGWRFNPTAGTVTPVGFVETDNPSFLAVHPSKRFLIAVNEMPTVGAPTTFGGVSAFTIDAASGKLTLINRVNSKGNQPASLTIDPTGKWVIIGNYGNAAGSEGSSVAVFGIGADGRLTEEPKSLVPHAPRPKRLDPAAAPPKGGNPPVSHPHHVLFSPDHKFLFVAEKGWDQVVIYKWDPGTGTLTPNDPPAVDATKLAAAPRHMAFGPSGKFLYVCYEAGRAVSTYAYDATKGTLTALDTNPTVPADAPQTGSCAEIEVHPDGKYLYVSNRGHNSLALFAIDPLKGTLTPQGTFPAGGTPRNFKIDPTGNWVISEGQNVNKSFVQKVDRPTGKLTMTGATLDSPQPVCIVFV